MMNSSSFSCSFEESFEHDVTDDFKATFYGLSDVLDFPL